MDERNNIEITLKSQEEEKTLNYSALGRRFQRMRKTAIRLLLAAILLGAIVGVVQNVLTSGREVHTLVNFGFEGIEEGLDPNGAVFDITKMSSPTVVQPVLDSIDVPSDVSAERIRRAMRFEGIVPQDALDRISVIQTISEKTPQALEELLNVSYHPIQYRITLDLKEAGVDKQTAVMLLDSICTSYQSWFLKTYSHQEALGTSVGTVQYTDYDYGEAADLLSVQLRTVSRYVTALQAEAPSFRSTLTNLSFADLNSNLDALRSVDLSKMNALIITNKLTKDMASLEAYYTYQIRSATNDLEAARERLWGIQGALAEYEKSSTVVFGETGPMTELTNSSEAYDNLVKQRVAANDSVVNLNARLKELQQNYAGLTAAVTPGTVAPANVKGMVEGLMATITEGLNQCIERINKTAQEYYETVAFRDAFQVQIPAQELSGFSMNETAKDVILYIVILVAVSFIALLFIVVFSALMSGDLYILPSKQGHEKGKRAKDVSTMGMSEAAIIGASKE